MFLLCPHHGSMRVRLICTWSHTSHDDQGMKRFNPLSAKSFCIGDIPSSTHLDLGSFCRHHRGSHQKRRERPAAIHFQCKVASMSGRRCELHELRELQKLRGSTLCKWAVTRGRRQPIGADLDSEGGKKAEISRWNSPWRGLFYQDIVDPKWTDDNGTCVSIANMQMQHKEGCPEYDPGWKEGTNVWMDYYICLLFAIHISPAPLAASCFSGRFWQQRRRVVSAVSCRFWCEPRWKAFPLPWLHIVTDA